MNYITKYNQTINDKNMRRYVYNRKPILLNDPNAKDLIVKLIHTSTGKKVIKFPKNKNTKKINRFWRREIVYSTSLKHPNILKAKRQGNTLISKYYGPTCETQIDHTKLKIPKGVGPLNKKELNCLKNILQYLDRKNLIYSDLKDQNLVRIKNKIILLDLESVIKKSSNKWLLTLIPPKYRKKNDFWIDRDKLRFGIDPLPKDWHWEIFNLYKQDHERQFGKKLLNYQKIFSWNILK